ncbi:hypothetical protein SCA04_18110 [Staphylococcus carnosus]|nr:hypothetical protein SCA04_18110 [Staphylococcus carnosus]GEP78974.1 hypothetical protein SCA05_07670 [Staphylococcus carnosus]
MFVLTNKNFMTKLNGIDGFSQLKTSYAIFPFNNNELCMVSSRGNI